MSKNNKDLTRLIKNSIIVLLKFVVPLKMIVEIFASTLPDNHRQLASGLRAVGFATVLYSTGIYVDSSERLKSKERKEREKTWHLSQFDIYVSF